MLPGIPWLLWWGTDWSRSGGEGQKVRGRKASEEATGDSDGAGTRVVESRAQDLLMRWLGVGSEKGWGDFKPCGC